MTTPAIAITDLHFGFDHTPVLEAIKLHIEPGEFIGVIGPNGGGKTTLLKLMLGLLRPRRGRIEVLGTTPEAARKRIGYCPQYGNFTRDFPITVSEAVRHARLRGWRPFQRDSREDRQAIAAALQAMDLLGLETETLGELSGGQLQRVLIARALACRPEVLLLDEPVAHVDPRGGAGLFARLKTLSDKMTIVVVSHDIGFISGYVDRVACLNRTLDCHETADLTGEIMDRLYGDHVKLIDHHHGDAPSDPSIPSLNHQA
jgi:zinc transport system ATP-binding protein